MRRSIPWLMAVAATGAAAAAVAQPVPPALQACVRLTQNNERLACFDREIAALSVVAAAGAAAARPAGASAPVAAAATSAPVAATASAPVAASAASAPVAASAASAPVAGPGAASSGAATSAAARGSTAAPLTPEQEFGLSAEAIRKLETAEGIRPAEAKPPKELTAHIASVSRNLAGREVFTLDNGQVWRQSETRSSFEAAPGDAVTISHGAMGSFWLATNNHNQTRVERVP